MTKPQVRGWVNQGAGVVSARALAAEGVADGPPSAPVVSGHLGPRTHGQGRHAPREVRQHCADHLATGLWFMYLAMIHAAPTEIISATCQGPAL